MARKDIKAICKNLGYLSIKSRIKLRNELNKKILLIGENPYLYQFVEKTKNKRRFFIQKYVIIYQIKSNYIIVKRMLPQKINYNQKGFYRIKSIK